MISLGLERYCYWVIGYWPLGNIHRYWVVLLLGDIFCCSDTQYNTNQRAVRDELNVHIPVNDYLVPLLTCTQTDAIFCLDTTLICCCLLNTIIVIIIEFLDFLWSLLCSTQVLVLVLGIGIARGQYYWVLDIGCLSWYRSNPRYHSTVMAPLAPIFVLWWYLKTFICLTVCLWQCALGCSWSV